MGKIAKVGGTDKWAVLFDGNNSPISWGEIVAYDKDNGMVILEGRGQYPERLILDCDSALTAQETFEAMVKVEERMICEGL